MQNVFLEQYPAAAINILIVWLKMYAADTHDEVDSAARLFGDDPRVTQFYDPEYLSGLEIAGQLGASSGEVAWDVYLFFDEQSEWADHLPQPVDWVHQLKNSGWATPKRLYQGQQLSVKLQEITASLLQNEKKS